MTKFLVIPIAEDVFRWANVWNDCFFMNCAFQQSLFDDIEREARKETYQPRNDIWYIFFFNLDTFFNSLRWYSQ